MANASETKVTRRDAILTTGKAAVALGAAALLTGRLPKIQPLNTGDTEDKDADDEVQPTGGLRTAVVSYTGTDPGDTSGPTDTVADGSGGVSSNPVDLGLVPIQFVISEVSTYDPITGATSGTPITSLNTISVMTVGGDSGDDKKHIFVSVWTDQFGRQAILPASSSTRPIVVGTSVDVEALEDAVRGRPSLSNFTINNQGTTYLVLAFGSHSSGPPQDDDDNDTDG